MKKFPLLIMLILLVCFTTSITQATNLVVNGDFESGKTGFITGYIYTDKQPDGLGPEGYYAIGTDPSKYNQYVPSYGDHTSGAGNMMIVNGATTPDVTVWQQTISVFPNTAYKFSLWISNWSPGYGSYNLAHLEYFINDISIGSCFAPEAGGIWDKFSETWQSGTNTTATIKIVDTQTAVAPNDFAIDDISLSPLPLVTTPNGGESWIAGTSHNIQWETSPDASIANVKIEYSANNGSSWTPVDPPNSGNSGSYDWLVPQVTSNQCLVRISDAADANIFDTSNNTFIIYQCRLNSKADLNNDCKVDMTDLALFANDWMRNGNPFDPGFTEPPTGMVFIPSGMFQMGDNFSEGDSDELPLHQVQLDSFYMGKYEIANGQYCQYLNSAYLQDLITVIDGVVYKAGSGTSYPYCDTSSDSYSQIAYSDGVFTVRIKGGRNMNNDPMVMVSWYGAVAYCNWRSQEEGKEPCYNLSTWECDFTKNGYRLPTEAEWEYAARGGLSGKRFPWGDTISHSQANYWSSSLYSYDISPTRGWHPTWNDGIYPYTSPVGSFSANGYVVYDMTGNAFEWCNDWYSDSYYSSSPPNNPTGPTSGDYRVLRGGGWNNTASGCCRVACRGDYYVGTPYTRNYDGGFRVVLNLK